jgi:myo-inositol-1(or 4)-monophosphatase
MAKAVLKAAQSLRRDFGEVEHLQISLKGPRDFVSAADKKAEHLLYRELSKARPEFGFLMEEGGAIQGKEDTTWIIDPLDGTSNFIHGLPHFCISVGVLKDNIPVAGVIYDPLRDEMFWAEKGGGLL